MFFTLNISISNGKVLKYKQNIFFFFFQYPYLDIVLRLKRNVKLPACGKEKMRSICLENVSGVLKTTLQSFITIR